MKIRVMTFNIQHGIDHIFGRLDLHLMAETIKRVGADIVGVNEVRGEGLYPDEPAFLARETGFNAAFGPAMTDSCGEYGNLILSRFPLDNIRILSIPEPPVKREGAYYEKRAIVAADVAVGDGITFYSSHFGLSGEEHICAVKAACDAIDACPGKLVFAGDFNMSPTDPVLAPLLARTTDTAAGFCDAKLSFPSPEPTVKIDYILVSGGITVAYSDIPAVVASDHRPHYADIEL